MYYIVFILFKVIHNFINKTFSFIINTLNKGLAVSFLLLGASTQFVLPSTIISVFVIVDIKFALIRKMFETTTTEVANSNCVVLAEAEKSSERNS